MNRVRMISMILILAMTFSFAKVSSVTAQEVTPPEPPGWTQGTGTHFALPNSPYLPVTLDSSFPVTLTLSSVPEVVDLTISANPAADSAEFTLSGFAANTLYYRYADNGLDPVTFTTDASGSFTYTQDLSESHHVWFRDQPSTYYLYDNATGGDCTSFATWDWPTKTCTLTADVYQTIWFEADGITLDGNGFSSLYSDYYYAVYSGGYSDVTIKNLNVSGSPYGIQVGSGNNITVTNNTVSSYYYGIVTYQSSNLTVTNNNVSTYYYGIIVDSSSNFTVTDNTVTDAYYYGIYLWNADNGTIRGNAISNGSYYGGVYIDGYLYSEDYWYYGTHYVNSYDYSSTNNTVYQNNFVNVSTPITLANWGYTDSWDLRPGTDYYGSYTLDTDVNVGNVFNLAAPAGGNYYSQYDESAEGCDNTNSDSFCDSAFVGSGGAVDNLPWTTQDGWATPPDTSAPTASPTQSPAANGAGWNNTDVTVDWNWSDEAGGSGIDNANCTISTVSSGEGNPITLNATCKDLAGNEGNASYDVKVDKTLPAVSLVGGPSDGGSYYFGSVPAAPTCSASDALSGLDGSCNVSGYSSLVGPQIVTATAEDVADNQNNASASYTVLAWTTNGFFQPVDMGGVWNTVKGGSTVPLKFEVFAGSTELTDTSIVNQPLKATQALCGGGTTDEIELVATGATSLRYDSTEGQFIYNWKTPKKPGYCYVVTITMADGSTISANFRLK